MNVWTKLFKYENGRKFDLKTVTVYFETAPAVTKNYYVRKKVIKGVRKQVVI